MNTKFTNALLKVSEALKAVQSVKEPVLQKRVAEISGYLITAAKYLTDGEEVAPKK